MSDPHDPLRSAQRRRMPTGVIARTRLVVGIDLGTTNTALAWVDRQSGRLARTVRPFDVPQLTDPGVVRPVRTLPSAAYVRGPHELSGAQVALPWDPEGAALLVCGHLARQRGALTPDRLITSAKSWLCHPGVDRKAAILPWGAPDEVQKVSPIAVEAALLRHVRDAWNHAQARDDDKKRLERADVVVTLPASFDEVARELTVQAVHEAGLEDAVLIEEPTAALYAWIAAHEREWPDVLAPGQTILVCDVGGGTTDLSLIRVTDYRPPAVADDDDAVEPPGFERVAVGEHLLLGGDNMDHALARRVEERLGKKLDLREWTGLVIACRDAKEKLLEGQAEAAPIVVTGRGARLIGGTLRTDLTRAEVLDAVLEGFFPRVTADEPLPRRKVGLKELGLPYEPDPAVTRHLRRFLARHAPPGAPLAKVDHVLFNGGVFKTAALRERVLDVLASWQERPRELEGSDLDLAVAHGAAYYGLVRRGKGTRIKSGAGRAYYLEVRAGGGERTALCLIPRGLEEGGVVTISDHPLEVRANTPVVFPFHTATGRDDAAGALLPVDPEQLEELAPLHTIIRAGKRAAGRERTIPVELVARYTELGTLEIWLQEKGADRRWRLELDTRPRDDASGEGPIPRDAGPERPGASSARLAAVDRELPPEAYGAGAREVDPERVERARKHAVSRFRKPASEARALEGLGKELEEILGGPRETWPVPVIRALFDALMEDQAARRRSPAHEARWLNLVGFCLRPGFGATLDFDRVGSMWKVFLEGPAHPGKEAVDLEWLVAFRRVAGGLKPGQQEAILSRIQAQLLGQKKADKQELAELWRLVASLELIPPRRKRQLGDLLVEQLERGKAPPRWGPWALGRLGGRAPLYGPLDRLVPPDVAAGWLSRLIATDARGDEAVFACVQLARRTGDRSRDVPDDLRARARAWLERRGVDARTLRPLDEVVQAELRTESDFYGDSVPIGLVLGARG
ncbi:MAG: hsp70 family protein [Planctomycetes bacterium]|nr:hsp70 family protein [Planctomycetota bacterium]